MPAKTPPPDKRAVIADVLLSGAEVSTIYPRLVAAGISPAAAKYEAERAPKDPLFVAAQKLRNRLAKRDWTLDIYAKLAAMDPARAVIPTVHDIAREEFFRDYYYANRPVILTGLVDHWAALERWTLDYLDAKAGKAVVEIQVGREAEGDYEIAKDRHKRHLPMSEVIAMLRDTDASNDFYITAYNSTTNTNALAALWADLGPVSLLQPSGRRDGYFWLGPKGTLTPFHHDLTNNLLVQVMGRKRVKMVASHDVALMRNSLHCFSDWGGDDLVAGPRVDGKPQVLECDIGPGEAIFLPIGWWHHVEALDVSISMSFTNFAADNDFYSDYVKDTVF